ncbi:hypothetical protein Agub_g4086 [Astrephomene gubernaculifera]|uniref:Protein kinase domain-containing protein n=1 Tax=Astrephomene gubernaculifera TaxID=47775 RepID=A0AAD3DJN9_9CHLO|nr:hypothetical protein Agub_g4086 [Astrephomene gubernaculifera]
MRAPHCKRQGCIRAAARNSMVAPGPCLSSHRLLSLHPSTLLLPLLLLWVLGVQPNGAALASATSTYDLPTVSSELQLMAAVNDSSVPAVRLAANVRLTSSAWPASPIVRSTNFSIVGADFLPILDLNFVESRIQLLPGVVFNFSKLELRNTRQRSGFEVDLFSASPGAIVHFDGMVYFCFSCLPLATLMTVVNSSPPAGLPQNVSYGSWCRTLQPPLARCYNENSVLKYVSASTQLPASGLVGLTSGGGYAIQAWKTVFVCQQPIMDDCGLTNGWDYCVRTKVVELQSQDNTWELLAAYAAMTATPSPSPGGAALADVHGGRTAAVAAGAAVGGFVALAATLAAIAAALYKRRRLRHQQLRCVSGMLSKSQDGCGSSGAGHDSSSKPPYSGVDVKPSLCDAGTSGDSGGGGSGGATVQVLIAPPGGGEALPPCLTSTISSSSGAPSAASGRPAREPLPQPPPAPAAAAPTAAAAAVLRTAASSELRDEGCKRLSDSQAGDLGHAADGSLRNRGGGAAGAGGGGRSGGSGAPPPVDAVAEAQQADPQSGERDKSVVMVAGISIELSSNLGTGSFGKVFRGCWQGRPVAVKVLQYGAELCRAVQSEVLLSQTLRHPNVVSALYFAQVLPGGRLGLHTGGGGGGPPSSRKGPGGYPVNLLARPVPHGQQDPQAAARGATDAGSYSRFIESGVAAATEAWSTAAGAADGGGGGGGDSTSSLPQDLMQVSVGRGDGGGICAAAAQALLPLSSSQGSVTARRKDEAAKTGEAAKQEEPGLLLQQPQQPDDEGRPEKLRTAGSAEEAADVADADGAVEESACVAASARGTLLRPRPRSLPHGSLGQSVRQDGCLELTLRAGAAAAADPTLAAGSRAPQAGGAAAAAAAAATTALSTPLTLLRTANSEAADPLGLFGDDSTYDTTDDGSGGASRSQSEPDVLSRWAEQRRRQAQAERTGAQLLVIPEARVTPNGYVVRAGGPEDAASAATPPPPECRTPRIAKVNEAIAAATAAVMNVDGGRCGGGGAAAANPSGQSPECAELTEGTSEATVQPPAPAALPKGGGAGAAAPQHAQHGAAPGAGANVHALDPRRRSYPEAGKSGEEGDAVPSGAAPAAAASAEPPLEALWLAAHTQPAEGSSHGFLVMELCEGGSVFAWRAAHWKGLNERPDLAVLLRLALDIAYGMSYIHSIGICHGDLKLSNVLLARCDSASGATGSNPSDLLDGWVAKVCDFGLSRVLTNDRTHVSTRPYGTPTHMAPELWTKGHVSQQADVYAFGVTLWELATGLRPYKGLNAARILHRVLLSGGRPVLPLWLPPSYTRLVTSCWAQSPKDRPTFGEIVRHLEAMLAVLTAVTPR